MKFSTTLVTAALAAAVSAQEGAPVDCVPGLHVIVARASTEKPGYGILAPVKDEILQRVPQSNSVWVPYPATIVDPVYTDSEPEGVGNLTELIKAYVDKCPGGKIALLGYSQGAQVIGDTLIGGDYSAFPAFVNGTGIGQKYIDPISAVIMMGDPANKAGVPFLVGNSTRDGFFPRNNTASWESTGLLNKTRSYCDAEDTYCDKGTEGNRSLAVHIGYIAEYGGQAADYVVARAPGTSGADGNATVGNNGTTAASATGPRLPTQSSANAGTLVAVPRLACCAVVVGAFGLAFGLLV